MVARWSSIRHATHVPEVVRIISSLLVAALCLMSGGAVSADAPIGWAVIAGNGVESTTGGGDGQVVVAKTIQELVDYAKRSEPLTILVEGTLSGRTVNVASNKTILGVGSNAKLVNALLNMNGVSNIIIRNLTISKATDGIAMRGTHHVWIDHCDLSDCGDGLIDITRESDFHTVSWTRFSNHHKTMLINGGSTHLDDAGKLNTTLHHNWWDGSDTRNPRAGFGKVHVFNCLYNNNGYGIGLHSQCLVLAECNFFDRVSNPIQQMYRPDPADPAHGFCESVDNIFIHCSGDQDDEGISFPVDDYYLYDFALDDVNDVPAIVKATVGPAAEFGILGPLPVPGNGAVGVVLDPVLTWTSGHEATGYRVAFGDTNEPPIVLETDSQTFAPGTLDRHTVYYWRVDQITPTGVIEGYLWRFRTETAPIGYPPDVSITLPSGGATFSPGSDIVINAHASDRNGTIVSVEFCAGSTLLGTDTESPYSILWPNVKNGTYDLTARAFDNDGNMTVSAKITVSVTDLPNGGGTPR